MMKKLNELSPFAVFGIGFGVVGIIFGIFSFFNDGNLLLRIYAGTSYCLLLLLVGIDLIVYRKQKKSGYFSICAAIIVLYTIIFLLLTLR